MVYPPLYPIGPRLVQLCKIWAKPAAVYSGAGAVALTFFCEWKAVLQYVPIYNQKYKTDE